MREYFFVCISLIKDKEMTNNQQVYTVKDFLSSYPMSKATFYKLIKKGKAPKLMRVMGRIYITKKAAMEWEKEMQK